MTFEVPQVSPLSRKSLFSRLETMNYIRDIKDRIEVVDARLPSRTPPLMQYADENLLGRRADEERLVAQREDKRNARPRNVVEEKLAASEVKVSHRRENHVSNVRITEF